MSSSTNASLRCESFSSLTDYLPWIPAWSKTFLTSSFQSSWSYFLVTSTEKISKSHMNAESFVSDYLPDPPSPTNKALPFESLNILAIQSICLIASSNRTKCIGFFENELKSSKYEFAFSITWLKSGTSL